MIPIIAVFSTSLKKNYLFIIILAVASCVNIESQSRRYEPLNVSYFVQEDQLNIEWSHPLAFNHEFEVSVNGIENKFSKREFVKHPKNSFQVRLPRSATFSASVCTNGKINQCTKQENIVIPPTTPELRKEFITVEDGLNNTKIVTIPGIWKHSQTINSYMYITVCDSTEQRKQILENDDDKIVLFKIFCSGTSWVAGILKTNTNDVKFTVGAGKTPLNPYENPALINSCYNYYNICAVVMNEYGLQYSYKVYCAEDDGYDYNHRLNFCLCYNTNLIVGSTALGVVFLGIVITGIVCCVGHCKKKKQDQENQQSTIYSELKPLHRREASEPNSVGQTENEERQERQPEIQTENERQPEVHIQNDNVQMQSARVPLQTSL